MSVLKYFKNIPRSPPHRATGLKCIFFFKFVTRSLAKKKKKGLSPTNGRQGPVAHWAGDRVPFPVPRLLLLTPSGRPCHVRKQFSDVGLAPGPWVTLIPPRGHARDASRWMRTYPPARRGVSYCFLSSFILLFRGQNKWHY